MFQAMNNDAEYDALITGLILAVKMKGKCLAIPYDSMLVVQSW